MAIRRLLVTCALPYANGPIHLGHLVEYIQADIWVRFQKLLGNHCVFICGDDAHGTPIMLAAREKDTEPEILVQSVHQQHKQNLQAFGIHFDCFLTTHISENQALSCLIYKRMQAKGDISLRTISQAYDATVNMFLPDRYVKGNCPGCKSADQYGDNCEVCGSTYTPLSLGNPISVLSGHPPIEKESEHHFFKLSHYTDFLNQWIHSGAVPAEVANKLSEWFKAGLQDLDISRDSPYFGFKIPGTTDKYFYVWLDAPIAYIAIFKRLCQERPELIFSDYWLDEQKVELYHFIGKDIINFHAIFWPAILKSSGFRTPTQLFVHGHLTIHGKKMSKSRQTFIEARRYLQYLSPEYLRYYFASKLSNKIEDIDFNSEDFVAKINADLIGKWINIASRCSKLINTHFSNKLATWNPNPQLIDHFIKRGDRIGQHFEDREYSQAIRDIMQLTDLANQYIDQEKPWTLLKQPETKESAQAICTVGLNLFRMLMLYLKPVLPTLSKKVECFLAIPPLTWNQRHNLLLGSSILPYTPLLQRIRLEMVQNL